jgi:hypothetical protein
VGHYIFISRVAPCQTGAAMRPAAIYAGCVCLTITFRETAAIHLSERRSKQEQHFAIKMAQIEMSGRVQP